MFCPHGWCIRKNSAASEIPMGFSMCFFLAAPAHAGPGVCRCSRGLGNPIYLDHGPVMKLYNSKHTVQAPNNSYEWFINGNKMVINAVIIS